MNVNPSTEMLSELAKRPDVHQTFTEGRSQHEWMQHLYAQSRERIPELPDYEEFRNDGIFKKRDPQEHYVAYNAFREDPQANPLTTPSGKLRFIRRRWLTLPLPGNCQKAM